MAGETADPIHVAYAIEQIDRAIGSLCFEPFDDPAREARVTLGSFYRLLFPVAEGLDECACFQGAATKIREAAEHLAGASALLPLTRS